jgi:hypothetical protein
MPTDHGDKRDDEEEVYRVLVTGANRYVDTISRGLIRSSPEHRVGQFERHNSECHRITLIKSDRNADEITPTIAVLDFQSAVV